MFSLNWITNIAVIKYNNKQIIHKIKQMLSSKTVLIHILNFHEYSINNCCECISQIQFLSHYIRYVIVMSLSCHYYVVIMSLLCHNRSLSLCLLCCNMSVIILCNILCTSNHVLNCLVIYQ